MRRLFIDKQILLRLDDLRLLRLQQGCFEPILVGALAERVISSNERIHPGYVVAIAGLLLALGLRGCPCHRLLALL